MTHDATIPVAPTGSPTLRTYLVEDSSVILDNLIGLLDDTVPLDVVGIAEDEETAIAWLQEHASQVDLVIIDIMLKSGSGLGVLAACRRPSGSSRWIVLSNHATPEMRRRCLEYGADAVFDKSNEIDSLLIYCKSLAGLDVIADAKNSLADA